MTDGRGQPPLIVGAAQISCRPQKPGAFIDHEPADLMAASMTAALARAGLDPHTPIDLVAVVPPLAWGYHDLPGVLANRSGIPCADAIVMDPGGNAPVDALLEVGERIANGSISTAIVVGGEAMYSRRRAKREGVTLEWTPFSGSRDLVGNQRPLTNALEERHGLFAPRQLFPLLENAHRAHQGWTLSEHRNRMATLLATNSKSATTNPHAWFPRAHTVEDLMSTSVANRMICFPYTRLMNAVMEVDMAGALVVVDHGIAERFGIPATSRVNVLGGASAQDAWTPSERPILHESPALHAVAEDILRIADRDADQIDAWDLYSCFPIAITFAAQAFGLTQGQVPLTVTGGLAYAGGPGSSYAIHSLATMFACIAGSDDLGVVTGLGNIATKHAGVVLAGPGVACHGFEVSHPTLPPTAFVGPDLVDFPSGPATIETYTVECDRDGEPSAAPLMIRLPDGTRSMALLTDVDDMRLLLTSEGVGRAVMITPGAAGEPNMATFLESEA